MTVNELELLLRALGTGERDVGAIETQAKKIKAEAEEIAKTFIKSSQNAQTDTFIKQINKKMVGFLLFWFILVVPCILVQVCFLFNQGLLESAIAETRGLQNERRVLIESKLAGQRIIEVSLIKDTS